MSGCACGHHHHHPPAIMTGGQEITLNRPMVALSGQLKCPDMAQMLLTLDLLPEHAALSNAEPGNLRFDVAQQDDPLQWQVDELFADAAAFDLHQTRTKASRWGQDSTAITRNFIRNEVMPRIRAEHPQEHAGISALLRRAFDGPSEARLVENLRDHDDLALSLVADAAGSIIGHVALSPITAEGPAIALAPVAVHPAVQGRGIGTALIRAALEQFAGHTIIVLGDPGYYRRFGFAPVDLASAYAGPHLLALGPALPAGSAIHHAAGFAAA